ncbi:MAG: helix-turn-helix domain-containing protein [Elusimicrobia bacterium]|nr:helix-turn-helix domain-containing protein [Elusimicrobiota bacterium]
MPNEYLSIPEAAAILGISRIAAFKRVKKGALPAIRIGRNWAVPAFAVAAPGGRPAPAAPPAAPHAAPGSDDGGMGEMGWD